MKLTNKDYIPFYNRKDLYKRSVDMIIKKILDNFEKSNLGKNGNLE